MKQHIKSKVRRHEFAFNVSLLIGIFCLAFSIVSYGQQVQHKIEKEIAFSDEGLIKITAPQSVRITGSGTIYTKQEENQYLVSKKSSTATIFMIDKTLTLNTWNKQSIKQVSAISFSCETPEQEKQLIEALSINLAENAAGVVEVGSELNINKFQVENGWFSTENNHIILDNGKVLPITYLSISTMLYVPIDSKVSINAKDNDIIIDRHEGVLEINAVGGSLVAKRINDLNGNLKFATINIDSIDSASIELQKSTLTAISINDLKLESSISKVDVRQLNILHINKSVNDQFSFGAVQSIKASNSIFSNYNIGTCTENIDMTLKSGDIDIKHLSSSLQFAFIKNKNAKVQINADHLESYSLDINSFTQAKYSLPDNLVMTKSGDQTKSYQSGLNPEKIKLQIDCIHCDVFINNTINN